MHMTMKRIIETINNKMKGGMSNADIERKIIQESQRLGIDKIGFTHAEPFIELEDSLHEQRERGYNSGFEHQNVEERIYPEKRLSILKALSPLL